MTDERLQHQISLQLKIGISVSGILMFVGFIISVVNPTASSILDDYQGWKMFSVLFSSDFNNIIGTPELYLFTGIIALMLTPIIRVILTVIGFAIEKDWRYVVISMVVLCVISISIAFSIVH